MPSALLTIKAEEVLVIAAPRSPPHCCTPHLDTTMERPVRLVTCSVAWTRPLRGNVVFSGVTLTVIPAGGASPKAQLGITRMQASGLPATRPSRLLPTRMSSDSPNSDRSAVALSPSHASRRTEGG